MKKINWKSKKTIAVIVVIVIILLALLVTGIVFAVKHSRAESLPATLPVAEEVTAAEVDELSTAAENVAEAANTAPASTTTPVQVSGATNFKTSASSNNSTGSKNTDTGKTGSSTNSGSASHSTGTNSKPATGSNISSSNSKPSGGSTANQTTTKPVTTTKPAKKEFAMTKDEIIAYASKYIEDTYHCTYYDGFGKNVPGTGYNAPFEFERGDSAEYIKKHLRGSADATYIKNGWYKVYVEQIDENTMRVYLFY